MLSVCHPTAVGCLTICPADAGLLRVVVAGAAGVFVAHASAEHLSGAMVDPPARAYIDEAGAARLAWAVGDGAEVVVECQPAGAIQRAAPEAKAPETPDEGLEVVTLDLSLPSAALGQWLASGTYGAHIGYDRDHEQAAARWSDQPAASPRVVPRPSQPSVKRWLQAAVSGGASYTPVPPEPPVTPVAISVFAKCAVLSKGSADNAALATRMHPAGAWRRALGDRCCRSPDRRDVCRVTHWFIALNFLCFEKGARIERVAIASGTTMIAFRRTNGLRYVYAATPISGARMVRVLDVEQHFEGKSPSTHHVQIHNGFTGSSTAQYSDGAPATGLWLFEHEDGLAGAECRG